VSDEPARNVTDEIVRLVRDSDKVVWLTGAGLSVASGISPYRKSKDAVWSRIIMDWGTIEKFHEDPLAWWREFWFKAHGFAADDAPAFAPNAGHDAITRLVKRNSSHLVITQNIDGLHRRSGVPEEQLVEIHGRHDRFVCTNAQCIGARDAVSSVNLAGIASGTIPRCAVCNHPMRPLVLLFDETYDSHPAYGMRRAKRALNDAEIVLFVGTSFSVGITDYAVRAAVYANARMVNVNTEEQDESLPGTWANLLGPSELTLPALAALVEGREPA
jgi:NAD-dependent SIR2 family protein deacetylase